MSLHRKKCNCNCGKKTFVPESLKRKSRNIMHNPFTMVQSFAKSLASRGLKNNKADTATKQLRTLSCFGDKSIGGHLPRCQHLTKSSHHPGKFYCGGCGCGDRKATWLHANEEEYSKLDYPKLECPLKMPGFTNYEISENKENMRKNIIENYDMKKLVKITVSTPSPLN